MHKPLLAVLAALLAVACNSSDASPPQGSPDPTSSAGVSAATALDRACLQEDAGPVVDGIDLDLDGDGQTDQVRLHRQDDTTPWTDLTACFGNGRAGRIDGDGWVVEKITAVDLGGTPGVAVIADFPRADGELHAMFVRWADGRFGVQNELPPEPEYVELAYGTFHQGLTVVHDLDTRDASSQLSPGDSPGRLARETYGCRPSTRDGADFDLATISVTGTPLSDDVGPLRRWLRSLGPDVAEGWRFESRMTVRSAEGLGIMWNTLSVRNDPSAIGRSVLTLDSELDQALREVGFTPRCLPEGLP